MSQNTSANNKRIAKNTVLLYFRMLLTMAISLYTSRVVLDTLGVSDYGIYNVVGGFVALFTMVSGTMATATQRFLSFEIGKGTQENITRLFSTSIMIHVFLGCFILIMAETIGLWFVNNKLVFPEDRINAVNWVYQLSIFTLIINVLSVPYNASLIAYEKMKAFAYIGILDAVLKLLIVYLIVIATVDRLILYAFLLMLISVGNRILYTIYVKRNFKYCRCNWRMDKGYRSGLISFIGFNFIGSTANVLKGQGINVLLNMFFGTVVNAARGISVQVLNAVSGFATNFQLALNPQIIKLYAAGQKQEMFRLMFRGSKFSYLMMLLISLPIMINAPDILGLWLIEVPENTVAFVRLTLIITLVDSLSHTLITGVHASGMVKKYQLINGTALMMTLPLVYVVLYLGYPPYMAYMVSLCISVICHFIRLSILGSLIGFPVWQFLKTVTLRVFVVSIVALLLPVLYFPFKGDGFMGILFSCMVSFLSVFLCAYFIGLGTSERQTINKQFVEKIKTFNII